MSCFLTITPLWGTKIQWKYFFLSYTLTLGSHYPSKITVKVFLFMVIFLLLEVWYQNCYFAVCYFSSVIALGYIAIEYIKCKFSNSKFSSSKLRKTQTWAAQALTCIYNTKWLKMKDIIQINKFLWFAPCIRSCYITRSVRSDLQILLRYTACFHNANKNLSFSEWYQLVVITAFRISA